jgi:drug/metabolite transporter (DMT)-like permease
LPLDAFLLALAAAALHAGWNVLLARAHDVRAATTVALVVGVVAFVPFAVAKWEVEAEAVPWIVLSSALELAYFLLLTAAYRDSDVSLVYPIARGVAPVLVLLGGWIVGARLGALQAVGVILVGAGILLVRGVNRSADRRGVLLALAIAGTIAGYTLADNEGIEHASAIAYLELVLAPVALAMIVAYVATGQSAALRSELGTSTIAAGMASFGAYALALAALSVASAASVASVRETSVLFAVALGAAVLHERVTAWRALGAVLVVTGVVLVAVA